MEQAIESVKSFFTTTMKIMAGLIDTALKKRIQLWYFIGTDKHSIDNALDKTEEGKQTIGDKIS